MSVNKPRTIDNLGVETSRRYADDRAKLDQKLIDDSRFIPLRTEVSVVKPYLPTDFDAYLNTGKETIWASFAPPPEYAFTKPLFTFQLIPSLGGYEKQEADTDKLEALEDALQKQGKGGNQQNEKERKTILHLLKTIGMLDRTLVLINSRRNQYQRG
jgi:hypothetical protein